MSTEYPNARHSVTSKCYMHERGRFHVICGSLDALQWYDSAVARWTPLKKWTYTTVIEAGW